MNTKNKEEAQHLKDQRYEQISKAAMELFGQKGFAAAKISDIMALAGLSHGLFYHYFHSKEEVYSSIIISALDLFKENINEAKASSKQPVEQLEWLIRQTFFSPGAEKEVNRHIIVLQALQSNILDPQTKDIIKKKNLDIVKDLSEIMEEGQKAGQLVQGDPMKLAVYYMALNQGLIQWSAIQIYPVDIQISQVLRQLLRFPEKVNSSN